MRKISLKFAYIIVLCFFACASCSKLNELQDKLNELENRVSRLEEEVKGINNYILTLQGLIDALQRRDYVERIETLSDGSGYRIVFASGKVIPVYNGKNGKDGTTPEISLGTDGSGDYFWVINGDWLLVNGEKVRATAKDGEDGATPQLTIINGYWYISYGEGWMKLDKATGEDGKDATSFIKSISVENGFVIIVLNDTNNTVIRLKMVSDQEETHKDNEVLPIQDYLVKQLCLQYFDFDNDSKFTYGEARNVTNIRSYFKGKNITSFNELKYFTGLNSIGDEAFSGCAKLESIVIPESVNTLGDEAFMGCAKLESIALPESVNTIGASAFEGCTSLSNVVLPDGIQTLKDNLFKSCSSLQTIQIPESVSLIEEAVFRSCSVLTEINLSNTSVSTIKKYTFWECTKLNSIKLPDSLTTIEDDAFFNCSALQSIMLPKNITYIGKAFSNYGNTPAVYTLSSVYVFAVTPPVLNGGFPNNSMIYVPFNSLDAYKNAEGWSLLDYKSRLLGFDPAQY